MSWNVNQPSDSNWTNNATDAAIGVTAMSAGTSSIKGYKLSDNKSLYFGNDSDISIKFATKDSTFVIRYTNPITGFRTNILQYNTTKGLTLAGLTSFDFDVTSANPDGTPSSSPDSGGQMVYTQTLAGNGSFYLSVD